MVPAEVGFEIKNGKVECLSKATVMIDLAIEDLGITASTRRLDLCYGSAFWSKCKEALYGKLDLCSLIPVPGEWAGRSIEGVQLGVSITTQ